MYNIIIYTIKPISLGKITGDIYDKLKKKKKRKPVQ